MESDESEMQLDPVNALAEEYLRRRRRGEHPTPEEYAARYPEHAAGILELFPALELLEGLKPTPEDHAGMSAVSGAGGGRGGPAGGCVGRLGDYTLIRELGRGGMGIVYEAEHESLKSRMALKVMHPRFRADRDYVRRFQTEARSAAKLHHTNIVPVFDYGQQDGVCYYAMQYIDGVGLERVLEDVRRFRAAANPDNGAGTGSMGLRTAIDPGARANGHLTGLGDRTVQRRADGFPGRRVEFDGGPGDRRRDLGLVGRGRPIGIRPNRRRHWVRQQLDRRPT
jgi:hypothetical protein